MKDFFTVLVAAVFVGLFLVGIYWVFDTFLVKLPLQFYAALILVQLVYISSTKEK